MHDCCDHSIRLSQSFSCFLEAHVDLILFLTQYSSRVSTSFQCKIETNFSKFSPIFPEVCPLLLASYFSKKKFAGRIGAALPVFTGLERSNFSNSKELFIQLLHATW